MTDNSRLDYYIDDFNSLQLKHGLKSRVRRIDVGDVVKLVLGTEEQFKYDKYQCVLAEGIKNSLDVIKALDMIHCYEYGE